MAKKDLPSPEVLRQLLRYEPETGKLFWRWRDVTMCADARAQKIWNTKNAEKPAFTRSHNSYKTGKVAGKCITAHIVVWAIVYGRLPVGEVDHINGNRSDNRVRNLREVSPAENRKNMRLRHDNSSGFHGVRFNEKCGKWQAYGSEFGQFVHLGMHATLREAAEARKAFEVVRKYHPNHGRAA